MKHIFLLFLIILCSCSSTKRITAFHDDWAAGKCYVVKDGIASVDKKLMLCVNNGEYEKVKKDFSNLNGIDTTIVVKPASFEYRISSFTLRDSVYFPEFQDFMLCKIEKAPLYISLQKDRPADYAIRETFVIKEQPGISIIRKRKHLNCTNKHLPYYSLDSFEEVSFPTVCFPTRLLLLSQRLKERGYDVPLSQIATEEFKLAIMDLNKQISGKAEYRITRKLLTFLDLGLGQLLIKEVQEINNANQ